MGALTSNRKRLDECFTSYTPINSVNNSSNYSISDSFGTHIPKKPRLCSYTSSDRVGQEGKVLKPQQSAVSRLRKYPEPSGKLRREVHAPCSKARRFAFPLSSLVEFRPRVSERDSAEKAEEMGNGPSSALRRQYAKTKNKALRGLRFFKVREEKKVVERKEVVILEKENEVRSEYGRGVGSKGLGFVLESRGSDRVATESSSELHGEIVHSVSLNLEAYQKLLSSVDRTYTPKLSHLHSDIEYYEAKRRSLRTFESSTKKKEEERKWQELKKAEEDLLREPFVALTEEEENDVKHALLNSNRRRVLVTHENSNIQITGEMLQCLRPGAWLNDEVINVYLELLKERERREPKKFLNCHFFNTFFYKKLIGGKNGYDYKSVRRWTSQRKLGYKLSDCDKIFVPIHREVHWCLAVINKKDKTFQYLDSLGGRDLRIFGVLANYYVDEVKDKCGQDIDVSDWGHEFVEDLPEQQNGFDCGVFMIKYADFYSRGMGLCFSQENMPYFRRRTAKEILKLRAD